MSIYIILVIIIIYEAGECVSILYFYCGGGCVVPNSPMRNLF